jgi:hypothetical protein
VLRSVIEKSFAKELQSGELSAEWGDGAVRFN